jgi:hypothetical protein
MRQCVPAARRYVPVDVILKFSKIQELTDSAKLLVAAVADSTVRPRVDGRPPSSEPPTDVVTVSVSVLRCAR